MRVSLRVMFVGIALWWFTITTVCYVLAHSYDWESMSRWQILVLQAYVATLWPIAYHMPMSFYALLDDRLGYVAVAAPNSLFWAAVLTFAFAAVRRAGHAITHGDPTPPPPTAD